MNLKAQQVEFLLSQVRNTTGALAGGTVTFYAAGTTTLKTVWSDRDKATPAANPYTLDANGTAQLYADGLYKVLIKNAAGTTVYTRDNLQFTPDATNNDYYADPSAADQGATTNSRSIASLLAAIGTSKQATIVLAHSGSGNTTTYTVGQNADWSAYKNVTWKLLAGAVLQIATATTTTIGGSFEAGLYQQVFVPLGTGAVAGLKESNITWFGATSDSGTTDNKAAIKAAVAAVVSGGRVIIPSAAGYYKYDNHGGLTDATVIDKAITIQIDGTIKGTSSVAQVNPPYIFDITGNGATITGTGTLQGVGTYVVDHTVYNEIPGLIRVNADDVTIDGIRFVDPPETAIYIPSKDNLTVRNSIFTGGPLWAAVASAEQHYYIVGYGGDNHSITHNRFMADASAGVAINAVVYGSAVASSNLEITHNHFIDIHEHATYLTGITDSNVSHNSASYSQAATSQYGAGFKIGGKRLTIIGNKAFNAAHGFITTYAAEDVLIAHNVGVNIGYVGILVSGNVADASGFNRVIIDSNEIYMRTDGEIVYEAIRYNGAADTTANCVAGKITNNAVYNAGLGSGLTVAAIGVYHSNASYNMIDFDISDNKIYAPVRVGIYASRVTQSRFDRNTYFNPSTAASRVFHFATVTKSILEGNIARDTAGVANVDLFLNLSGTANNYIEMINNGIFTTANVANIGLNITYHVQGRGNRRSETDRLKGTFTVNGVASLVVANENIANNSTTNGLVVIHITPLNAAATVIQGSAAHLYVSALSLGTSFTVATGNGSTVAAADAIFGYEIIQ